jgi:hypothetical protein
MQNKVFTLSLFLLTNVLSAQNDNGQLAVALAKTGTELYIAHQQHQQSLPNERNFRRKIYWLDKNNPNWYMLDDFKKDFDYHIANLMDHIKVLEDKAALKKNGLHSWAIIRGAITSVLSGLCGYSAYMFHNYRKLAQNDLSLFRHARDIESQYMMNITLSFGLVSVFLGLVAAQNFDKAYRYAERILERLDRDKRILTLLEKEKDHKNNATNAVSEAALQLIQDLTKVVTHFSQPITTDSVVSNNTSQAVAAV